MADSIDDDWETSSKSSAHSDKPEASSRAPASDRSEHYRVNVGGDDIVVMSTLELLDALKVGRISATSLVWKRGMSEWTELGSVPALALLVPSAPKVPSGAGVSAITGAPSSPPPSASANPSRPSEPPANAIAKGSPLSPVTPVGARRIALPRNPVTRADLSKVRSTSPPVPRPSRPSMASIHPGVISPLGSKPVNPRPSNPVASRHDDDDDDDNVTQVVNTLKMRQIQEAHGKSTSAAPPAATADEKALAVYERPIATLAFAEEARDEAAQPVEPARPASLAPARIISVGPSERPPAPSRSAAPPPSRPATPPPPSSRPAAPSGAPPIRARQPSLPSIVVSPAPPPTVPAVTSLVPDSLQPITTPPPAEAGAAEQEYTHAGKRRRTVVTRNLVMASAGSALLASIVTAIAVHRPEPTPLVIVSTVPATASAVPAAPPAPVRPKAEETLPAVPVLSLSALPKAPPAPPKVARARVEVELAETAPTAPPPSFLTEAMESQGTARTASKPKPAVDDNPYGVELDDDEPARPAKPQKASPAGAQEAPLAEEPASAQSPGF